MIVSINWIKEFTNIPDTDPVELGTRFTMATCEVEEVKSAGAHLKAVIVAEVLSLRPHPEADKLNLVTVNVGGSTTPEVVCGAPNVKPGIKVPYAAIGVTLPGGFTLEAKKIRGILSEGMLCSETELEVGDDESGLMILPEDAVPGTTLARVLNMEPDVLFDIDNKSITHRPDLWGHYGMAREFSAVFGHPLLNPYDQQWTEGLKGQLSGGPSPVPVKVEDDSCCKVYYGLSVDNITVEPSPGWMQNRLIACGLRPINNIVDISNYVMLELGIPNHIFDREKIGGSKIHIRRTGKDETFVTLDEVERQLIPTDTVVADAEKPLVIAGIMGGLESGVTEKTTKVFLEVANWQDAAIRRTSTRLGLRTDSSQRYEKSLDSQLCERTLLRLLELILQVCPDARAVGGIEVDGPDKNQPEPLSITLTHEHLCTELGKELPPEQVVKILESLSFTVSRTEDVYTVIVPSYRATKDIECDADIIEEIGRIVGYDNIEPKSPLGDVAPVRLSPAKRMHRRIQDFFVLRAKALEVMTYPMVGEKLIERAQWEPQDPSLVLSNPISPDHDRMRPSLVPSMLAAAELNARSYDSFRLFEVGRRYKADEQNFSQDRTELAVLFYSRTESTFMDLANTVEDLLEYLNLSARLTDSTGKFPVTNLSKNWKGLHPNETLYVQVMGKTHGFLTTVHPIVAREFKVKGYLSLFCLDLADFEGTEPKDKTSYKPIPRYPSSEFDCTVIADERTPAEEVLNTLNGLKKKLRELKDVKLVDIFTMEEGKKAVTLRSTFHDPEGTLSGEFITDASNKVIDTLNKGGYPLKS